MLLRLPRTETSEAWNIYQNSTLQTDWNWLPTTDHVKQQSTSIFGDMNVKFKQYDTTHMKNPDLSSVWKNWIGWAHHSPVEINSADQERIHLSCWYRSHVSKIPSSKSVFLVNFWLCVLIRRNQCFRSAFVSIQNRIQIAKPMRIRIPGQTLKSQKVVFGMKNILVSPRADLRNINS
jgi:hypothetical protein